MSTYEAVLFDMDGVTVESASAWRELERTEILPAATGDAEALAEIRALSVADAYDRLDALAGVELRVDRATFDELYDSHARTVYMDRATLMEGYTDLLTALRDAGFGLGLVSASRREWVEMVLERFDLWDAYDTVVSSSDIDGPSKPDPTTYRVAAERLGVASQHCLVVEDSPHGIAAATGAGMDCLALRGDGNAESDLSAATAIVDSPAQLREALWTRLGL
jgi:HAD superfamily hydrolase (TIGR01509 family)